MNKKYFFMGFLFFAGLLFFAVFIYSAVQKVSFNKWPQIKTKYGRVLFAKGGFAHQGFAGASVEDFKNTFIIFPGIRKGVEFVNYDQGYGPVIKTLAVIFLDKKWKVLKISRMEKYTGTAVAPAKTHFVIECLPCLDRKVGFKIDSVSPITLSDSQLSE